MSLKSMAKWLLSFSLLELIVLCLFFSFRFVSLTSTVTLCVFSIFFASIMFLLKGSFTLKVGVLAFGNVVGLLWNIAFEYFSVVGRSSFGQGFATFYAIIYPLLNLMWVVPFWSISMGFFPKPRNAVEETSRFD